MERSRQELIRTRGESSERQAPIPSDAATDAEGRLYDVELHDVDDPTFHLRWGGGHAAAILAALRHGHRVDGIIHQVEWGSYEVVLDGAATRRLLTSVLTGGDWRHQLVEVVDHAGGELPGRRLPAVPHGPVVALDAAIDMLQDDRAYSIVADVY